MTTGSAQGVINTSSVANLLLPLPPSSFQKNIVDKIYNLHRRVDELKSVCQQKLKALSELKQSLLQKAFSGELTAEKAENEMQRAVAWTSKRKYRPDEKLFRWMVHVA